MLWRISTGLRRGAVELAFVASLSAVGALGTNACSASDSHKAPHAPTGGATGDAGAPSEDAGSPAVGAAGGVPGSAGTSGAGIGGAGIGNEGGANEAGAGAGGDGETAATFFVSDSINNAVYRFSLTPTTDPVLTATLHPAFQPAAIGLAPTGELLVAQNTDNGGIARYTKPLTTLTPNGSIDGLGTSRVWDMAIVDGELWAGNSTLNCSTDPASIIRVKFDASGTASAAGTITTGLVGADRGLLWNPATRSLFVGQCYPVNVIQHYQVATDESVTVGDALSDNAINNPEGMVLSPWGELFVPNFGNGLGGTASGPGKQLLRYTLDADGAPAPNGTIEGNGLNGPCYGSFTPWGELLVVNNVDGTLSRFTFDSSHSPIAHGTFQMEAAASPNGDYGVCGIVVTPGASTK